MAKKKIYVATIRVAVYAQACGNTTSGACEWFSGLLSENLDVLDWGYVPKGNVHPEPRLPGD